MKNSLNKVTVMLIQKRLNLWGGVGGVGGGIRKSKCLWREIAVTNLLEIILENEKYKAKNLLTNTKNIKYQKWSIL